MNILGIEVTVESIQQWTIQWGAVVLGGVALVKYVVMPTVRFFQRIDKVVTNVENQLYPNGGSSLRDAVTQIQQHLGIDPRLPTLRDGDTNIAHGHHKSGEAPQ